MSYFERTRYNDCMVGPALQHWSEVKPATGSWHGTQLEHGSTHAVLNHQGSSITMATATSTNTIHSVNRPYKNEPLKAQKLSSSHS